MSDENNVVEFPGHKPEATAEDIIQSAAGEFEEVCIFGWNKNGEFVATTSNMSAAETLYTIDFAKKVLMDWATGAYGFEADGE